MKDGRGYTNSAVKTEDCGVCCYVGTTFFGAVAYAVDITLLCPNLSGMRKMLNVAKDYSDKFNIVFNAGKTQLIPIGKRTEIMTYYYL